MKSQRRGVCHPVAELAKLSGSCTGSLAQRWCSRWMNDHAGNAMAGDTNTIAARPSVAFTHRVVLRERWAASWSTVNMTKMARAFAATVSAHGSRCSIAAQLERAKTARAARRGRPSATRSSAPTRPDRGVLGSSRCRRVGEPARRRTSAASRGAVPAYVMSPTSSSLGRILLLGALGPAPIRPRTLTGLML